MTRRTQVVLGLVVAVIMLLAIGATFYDRYTIQSFSMEPTLEADDKLYVRPGNDPRINDVIVFDTPGPDNGGSGTLVSRLVAIGGQEVTFADGQLYIDGLLIAEPFIREALSTEPRLTIPGCAQEEPAADRCVVPEGYGFVMGDNRRGSSDSRVYGPIDLETVRGVAGDPPFWLLIELLP